ncbi:replication initiation negative regulator SeqA [Mannheimia sp. AT1]|uniref:Negative modulator of initiation of replication n=1 Tax=Mannheimia cairinae TaxID=3025936 RepID=A0ABT5MRX7_9PAST|nr:replication initiation negative regulator SeqA [Mannheimia cairinae]MDD0824747.1 replication initiation negative regulator SeqA [Mannheimia cairinae]MDD0826324.1 replication initiation negative regulator SeqA [Mannheimia cairinae]
MKKIEIDDELYQYIASRTQSIGETASDILRRLLRLPQSPQPFVLVQEHMINELKDLVKTPTRTSQKSESNIEKIVSKLEKILASEHFINENKNVVRFIMLLAALYRSNPDAFAKATENVRGNERIYFSKSEEAILATGSSVKAKQIPDSPFWVITNNNTARKGLILKAVMESMKVPRHLIERIQSLFV